MLCKFVLLSRSDNNLSIYVIHHQLQIHGVNDALRNCQAALYLFFTLKYKKPFKFQRNTLAMAVFS